MDEYTHYEEDYLQQWIETHGYIGGTHTPV
jgi:hypothetical protein